MNLRTESVSVAIPPDELFFWKQCQELFVDR